MSFNSLRFLLFLPAVAALHRALPHKWRWILLLAASYFFYMSWNVWLAALILVTTVTAYGSALFMSRTNSRKTKKFWLIFTLVVCLGLLVFFKYANFLLESAIGVVRLFNAAQEDIVLDLLLPVGISFYTFQTLSYTVDVYRGNYPAERHFGYFALYVSFFPQLVAGPIERPVALLPQLKENRAIRAEDLREGAKWLLSGFFRKCVIADFCGIFADKVFADLGGANALAVFAASALFLVQIYNDFAGYSEIAVGSARLMGVKLSKNFDRPLTSASFTEFFRRWHVTLNQWFTEYVYIPLGGSRKGKARKIVNTLLVFFLCGLWHGASWTFVLWGLSAGAVVCAESLLKKPLRKLCERRGIDADGIAIKRTRQIFVFVLFVLCGIFFRAQSLAEAGTAFRQLFTAWGWGEGYLNSALAALGFDALKLLRLALCLAAMSPIYHWTKECAPPLPLCDTAARSATVSVYVYGILAIALFWFALLSDSDASGFAYFQF